MFAEGLRVLVVGDEHELKRSVDVALDSEPINDIVARGYRPQVLRMTMDEWTLCGVEDCLVYLSVASTNPIPAQAALNRKSYHAIDGSRSKYRFNAHDVYQELGHPGNEFSVRPLVARRIIEEYLHDTENPLVAVVLTEQALAWCDARTAWINQLSSETTIWCLHDDSDEPRRVVFDAVALQTDSPHDIG